MEKVKVVWICHLSNPEIRKHISIKISLFERIIRFILHKPYVDADFAQWNTNAIREFENFNDVDLHIICPYKKLVSKECRFISNNIYYYFFKDNYYGTLRSRIIKHRNKSKEKLYEKNSQCIINTINEIKPDIIHLIGAENLYYSLSILHLRHNIPIITQLQSLVNDDGFQEAVHTSQSNYEYWKRKEYEILNKSNYIGTTAEKFKINILKRVNSHAHFLNISLALLEPINRTAREFKYDFVYFSVNINKAVDYAIESFALAYKKNPMITLDIVGGYSDDYKAELDNRINELGIQNNVFFEGLLPTHDDVISQIRKSRFALLPLRLDLIPSTIREAMANGLPVLTTNTGNLGTRMLNKNADCVLITEIGDFYGMSINMEKLLNDNVLSDTLRENAYNYIECRSSNFQLMQDWVKEYKRIKNHWSYS